MGSSLHAPARRLLVTGGAGFVGSNLCVALADRHADWQIIALDNLKRRGSELNLPRLRAAGVTFVHGDVRAPADLTTLPPLDALVECSAEPSALAGLDGQTGYALHSNLTGAYHCLELARREGAQVVFLSTSRVYPIARLNAAAYVEAETRFELAEQQAAAGLSPRGVSEDMPLDGARTLYGATKLAAELLMTEYAAAFGLQCTIDRCGVIAGPWQMGKVDQGVFTHWMLAHHLGRPLSYIGFDGAGKQVRDLLHVADLTDLVEDQLLNPAAWADATVNVGGGRAGSLSLLETTSLCRELTGRAVPVSSAGEDRPGDIRIYLSDCERLHARTDWRPSRTPRDVLADILGWIVEHEAAVTSALIA